MPSKQKTLLCPIKLATYDIPVLPSSDYHPSMASLLASFFSLFFFVCFAPPSTSLLFPSEALPTLSGYLPVHSNSSSALFYAFYEAQQPPSSSLSKTPLLIWLNGGPGCSSLFGNFFELGPWRVTSATSLRRNPASWNRRFGLLFVDNPIGVGFSVAAAENEIPTDETAVADHFFTAIQHFLSLSGSSFRSRSLFITGESYAGKYVPAICYYILRKNPSLPDSMKVNLRGAAIGNGLTHPIAQVATHAETAYYIGLISRKQKSELEKLQNEAVRLTEEEKWSEATDARTRVISWLQNVTGVATLYDYSKLKDYPSDVVGEFLNVDEVKEALGVKKGIVWVDCSESVAAALKEDVMKSVKFMVEFLVERMRVLLYQGQNDLRDGVASTEAWVAEMEWGGLENFLEAERKVWRTGEDDLVAGYVQSWGNLSHVVVSGAGHFVPTDQGPNAQTMIEDWVLQKGLFQKTAQVVPKNPRRSNL